MDITDQNFESEILKSEMPVVVDFWADWCVPRRRLSPVIEEFACEFQGRIKVCRLDVDSNPGTTARFAIHSIPSLIFFKNGRLVEQVIGTCTKSRLIAVAKEVLDK